MLITKEQKDFYFKQVFDKFLEHHKNCYHFSDHILARELFDICVKELENEWHDIYDNPKDFNQDWVLVKIKDCITNEVYNLPQIAEFREDGWYKDDYQNTKISKETTLTEVIYWKEIE